MSSRFSADFTADFDSLLPQQNMDRRQFIKTSLVTGIALAAGTVHSQTMITTDSKGLLVDDVKIKTADVGIDAYRAMPVSKSHLPIVLVVQEIFGVHEHIRDVCRRFAHQGYLAIAPNLYQRQGDARLFTDVQTLLTELVSKVPDAQVLSDLDACADWAANNGGDPKRLAITGFCWGGRIVWLYAAHNPALKAGVAWYGKLVGTANELTPTHPVDIASRLHAPVLGLYGGQDQGIPLSSVNQMQVALSQGSDQSKDSQIHIYPDAPHAFYADYRPSYRKTEAEDGWQQALAWFKKRGV